MQTTSENPYPISQYAGVILAGGRSRRMGGGVKALLPLGEKTLLQHVLDRMAPQVDQLYLSVEAPVAEFNRYPLEQVADPEPGSNGPLGGLLASLQRTASEGRTWLLLAPCDAPLLPLDLAYRLQACAGQDTADIAVVRYASRLQPTFSLWNTSVLPEIERAVFKDGMAGFMQFLARKHHAVLDWPSTGANPFFNINDPAALAQAARMIESAERITGEE